ncbi:acyloxyacyl hydrolase [Candidatus Pelagibacter sp.]|nr:acyloxyacyl hydrolase [Candidatus Pelagibacter sp.]
MRYNTLNKIFLIIIFVITSFVLKAEESINTGDHQYNIYTGNFDFSDHKQKSILVGFQHQNENLERKLFFGNASPITGGFITEKSAAYVYTGVEWNYDLGNKMSFTPSFAPGLYSQGNGKDLGHVLEFKTEVQASYAISGNSSFGVSYNHISNASLGDKNPGANSYMVNYLKNF